MQELIPPHEHGYQDLVSADTKWWSRIWVLIAFMVCVTIVSCFYIVWHH